MGKWWSVAHGQVVSVARGQVVECSWGTSGGV